MPGTATTRYRSLALAVALLLGAGGREAGAFSILEDRGGAVAERLAAAARWSAEPDPFGRGTGLHDRLQVAVEPGFAAGLGVGQVAALYGIDEADAAALIEATVRRAFAAWETRELRFELGFGGGAIEGPGQGAEIDLFARPLPPSESLFGYADVEILPAAQRLLTNRQRLPGDVIVGADLFLNRTRIEESAAILAGLGLPVERLTAALQILVAHELGHALGLGHPNTEVFFDTDADPYNAMVIDPADPFAGLIVSAIPLATPGALLPIMWGGLSSAAPADLLGLLQRLADPALAFDDRGGRDVLYPSLPTACAGDCDADGVVTVGELVRGVGIALGELGLDACPAFDADADGTVRVDELTAALDAALSGC